MLIAKLFLPLSSPGFAAMGLGVLSAATGAYNLVEVIAIVIGLLVVAIAGVFTIRSNVAKIWREQAEGEKARNQDLTEQLADLRIKSAAELAECLKEHASAVAQHQVTLNELHAANQRTDQTPVMLLLKEILVAVSGPAHVEMTGVDGAPVKVENIASK